ncbi:MAG: phenylalanine--tRNA ligase subunit alpha [Thermoplasmata archaeon]|nr:phenylalanine--tRNA ligase subunit alpha [Thermoplasmata archaeon]
MSDPSEENADGATPISLSPQEHTVLTALRNPTELPMEEEQVANLSGLPPDTVRGSLQRLRSKHLAVVEEEHLTVRTLTTRGLAAARDGLPERRFLQALRRHGGRLTVEQATAEGLSADERSAAIGILRRRQLLADGFPFQLRDAEGADDRLLPEEVVLKQVANDEEDLDEAILSALERRGLVQVERRSIKRWGPSEEGRRLALEGSNQPLWGALTPADLTSGAWKGRTYRPYDVRAAVPYARGARENPYVAWLNDFADILVGLGFEETLGPLLETEFWNNDVLFMPQDHPARSIHDAFWPEGVEGHLPPEDLLGRVAAAHEGRALPGEKLPMGPGWGGLYDVSIASRPVLRSQTTAVSARYLARRPSPPFRTFSIDRNFRVESVDARHHLEFQQCEGIVGEDGVTLRHLIGIFRELTEAIGIPELKIRPSYFPFTEPSIEGYVRHPRLGWIEVLPGGLFRPEVLRPLGIEVPVAAWGIGVTRLAMIALGKNDIRELFCDDLDALTRGGP